MLTPAGEGMYSIIDRLEENRYLAFRHLGWVSNFEEQPIDEAAGGKVVQPKFPIGEHGFCALCMDTEGNMFGLHSMK